MRGLRTIAAMAEIGGACSAASQRSAAHRQWVTWRAASCWVALSTNSMSRTRRRTACAALARACQRGKHTRSSATRSAAECASTDALSALLASHTIGAWLLFGAAVSSGAERRPRERAQAACGRTDSSLGHQRAQHGQRQLWHNKRTGWRGLIVCCALCCAQFACTALSFAAENNQLAVAEYLIRRGADVNLRNGVGGDCTYDATAIRLGLSFSLMIFLRIAPFCRTDEPL